MGYASALTALGHSLADTKRLNDLENADTARLDKMANAKLELKEKEKHDIHMQNEAIFQAIYNNRDIIDNLEKWDNLDKEAKNKVLNHRSFSPNSVEKNRGIDRFRIISAAKNKNKIGDLYKEDTTMEQGNKATNPIQETIIAKNQKEIEQCNLHAKTQYDAAQKQYDAAQKQYNAAQKQCVKLATFAYVPVNGGRKNKSNFNIRMARKSRRLGKSRKGAKRNSKRNSRRILKKSFRRKASRKMGKKSMRKRGGG